MTSDDLPRNKGLADEVVCLSMPEPFLAVGRFYWNFDQTTDDEVVELLGRARAGLGRSAALAR
jgi:predicted phosphoribosyltransferase